MRSILLLILGIPIPIIILIGLFSHFWDSSHRAALKREALGVSPARQGSTLPGVPLSQTGRRILRILVAVSSYSFRSNELILQQRSSETVTGLWDLSCRKVF